ncbi:MAG: helix-turn-helix domain-containing protein, partial [Planctomycetota bacterium]
MRLAVHLPADHVIRRHPAFAALSEREALVEWPGHTWSGSRGLGESEVHGFLVAADGARAAARLVAQLQTQGQPWTILVGDPAEPAIWSAPELPSAESADKALLTLIRGAQERARECPPASVDEAWLLGGSTGAQRLRHDFEARVAEGPGDLLILGSLHAGAHAVARELHRRWTAGRRPLIAGGEHHLDAAVTGDLWIEVEGASAPAAAAPRRTGLTLWLADAEPTERPGLRDLRRLELPDLDARRADLPIVGAALLERLPGSGPRAFQGGPLEAAAWLDLARSGPLELVLTLLRQGSSARRALARPDCSAPNVEAPAAALPQAGAPRQDDAGPSLDLEDWRLETLERRLIERVLAECAGNKSQAAGLLGLH